MAKLNDCSVTKPFFSAKVVACETRFLADFRVFAIPHTHKNVELSVPEKRELQRISVEEIES